MQHYSLAWGTVVSPLELEQLYAAHGLDAVEAALAETGFPNAENALVVGHVIVTFDSTERLPEAAVQKDVPLTLTQGKARWEQGISAARRQEEEAAYAAMQAIKTMALDGRTWSIYRIVEAC